MINFIFDIFMAIKHINNKKINLKNYLNPLSSFSTKEKGV